MNSDTTIADIVDNFSLSQFGNNGVDLWFGFEILNEDITDNDSISDLLEVHRQKVLDRVLKTLAHLGYKVLGRLTPISGAKITFYDRFDKYITKDITITIKDRNYIVNQMMYKFGVKKYEGVVQLLC